MKSLSRRLLLAAGAVLVVFLGLTGLVLDRAFRTSVEAGERDRLQGHIYALLSAAERSDAGLVLPTRLPEARFSTPDSGLYARVVDGNGEPVWRSPSLLGTDVPFVASSAPGEPVFERLRSADDQYFGSALRVLWEGDGLASRSYTFQVSEDLQSYWSQVGGYRRALWGWFAGVAAVLLFVLGAVLHWGLRPLRRVERDLADVRAGRSEQLQGSYPAELTGLTDSINTFIASERARQERYRNALADLAHSLKTPLAVLRGAQPERLAAVVRDQSERMARIVDYQLQRAASSGHPTLGRQVAVGPVLERIRASLDKVYRRQGLHCELDLPADCALRVSEEDLMEMCGNVLDNAYKWARSRIRVHADDAHDEFVLCVEDDGPGIAQPERERVLSRGARADESVGGHGIGLAVMRDIAAAYAGTISIDKSPRLGGARVCITLPVH